ncbi:MAG: NAD(P)-dependent glycerol-3-phosphate dehydrogenase [Planctomycetota bacterium]|nr:NAD(P)-dependent glycerol-3-phosphate dehydrogenase [Planctomycetota bacterium]MDG2144656.1 NAD(P)-dependent glycerol-3-phosphate dehydrogenase [Planctomycetota bacterium]
MTNHKTERALVIGDGSWGTALAIILAKNNVPTTLWSAFPEQSADLEKHRENRPFLPGIKLPDNLAFSADPQAACQSADLIVSVVPTQFLRSVALRFEQFLGDSVPIISATKGLEIETMKSPTSILLDVLGKRDIGVLTGPSHAEEVALGKPASVVAASESIDLANKAQEAFNCPSLRVYTSTDRSGAELAAALKNVIALAAGISDGLELGDNAKAALLTRGMVEMARYGKAHGADSSTFFGLAGFGDLVTTACSQHSRNRAVGERIGRGETLEQVLDSMKMVAEGVWTTQALFGPQSELLEKTNLPIAEQVYSILFNSKDPREAVFDLMTRAPTGEMDSLVEELS